MATASKRMVDDAALAARIARHEAERAQERARYRRWADSESGDYREGFIDGYLRAYDDGQEYACSIERAELAFGKYLSEGGRALPRNDVDGW